MPTVVQQRRETILSRLGLLHPKSIDLSLGRTWRLLRRLGNPEQNLPPVVHIAGTNGKGSTLAFMRAGLEAAGYRVHVAISPHLVEFNERIRISGNLIDDDWLIALLEECESANGGESISFFEITTVAALLAFSRAPADIVLLETGLGGRFDTTNVIAKPAQTLITPISMDHQQFLGNSLTAIAYEKAGIFKPGVDAIIAPQKPEAATVLHRVARHLNAPIHQGAEDWHMSLQDSGLIYKDASGAVSLPTPKLLGAHQIINSGLATAALKRLSGFSLNDENIAAGLAQATWPGRLQRLQSGPLIDRAGNAYEIWADGGHNPAAGEAIASFLTEQAKQDNRPLHLIVGMLKTKDLEGYLTPFLPLSPTVHTIAIPGEPASLTATEVAEAALALGFETRVAGTVEAAIEKIDAQSQTTGAAKPRLLISGSLYLMGHILRHNQ